MLSFADTRRIHWSIFGLPRQWVGLATSVRYSPRRHSLNMNGPVPTGRLELNSSVLISDDPSSTCLGRMPTSIVVARNGQSGPLRVTWNVAGLGASKDAMLSKRVRNGVLVFASRTDWKVNFTSSAVKGCPSDHLTLGRM